MTAASLSARGGDHFGELLGRAQSTAVGDDDLCCRQFGTVALGHFAAHKGALAAVGHGSRRFHRRRAASGSRCVKAGVTHGDDLDCIGGLYGGNGVARVDGALKGVGRVDLGRLQKK